MKQNLCTDTTWNIFSKGKCCEINGMSCTRTTKISLLGEVQLRHGIYFDEIFCPFFKYNKDTDQKIKNQIDDFKKSRYYKDVIEYIGVSIDVTMVGQYIGEGKRQSDIERMNFLWSEIYDK